MSEIVPFSDNVLDAIALKKSGGVGQFKNASGGWTVLNGDVSTGLFIDAGDNTDSFGTVTNAIELTSEILPDPGIYWFCGFSNTTRFKDDGSLNGEIVGPLSWDGEKFTSGGNSYFLLPTSIELVEGRIARSNQKAKLGEDRAFKIAAKDGDGNAFDLTELSSHNLFVVVYNPAGTKVAQWTITCNVDDATFDFTAIGADISAKGQYRYDVWDATANGVLWDGFLDVLYAVKPIV